MYYCSKCQVENYSTRANALLVQLIAWGPFGLCLIFFPIAFLFSKAIKIAGLFSLLMICYILGHLLSPLFVKLKEIQKRDNGITGQPPFYKS
jgi:hypothetical protein